MANHDFTIRISDITADTTYRYRETLDSASLIPSLKQDGQLVPILVRPAGSKYQLISGFSRVAALKEMGERMVLARVLENVSDDEARRISLAENLERNPLTAWEQIITAYKFRKQGLSNAQVASHFRVSIRTIQRYLRVAEAPEDFQKALQRDDITIQQAYEAIKKDVPLSELIGRGRSVRYLRNISKKTMPKKNVRISRKADGEVRISIRYNPKTSPVTLNDLFKEARRKLKKSE